MACSCFSSCATVSLRLWATTSSPTKAAFGWLEAWAAAAASSAATWASSALLAPAASAAAACSASRPSCRSLHSDLLRMMAKGQMAHGTYGSCSKCMSANMAPQQPQCAKQAWFETSFLAVAAVAEVKD